MSGNSPIYAITCLEKIEDKGGLPSFRATAFMGFYHEKDSAFRAVLENRADIAEHFYDYAVIERLLPGLYSFPKERWLFVYDPEKDRFRPVDEPAVMAHLANVL